MVIRGETNILKVYDLTPFVDISAYDLANPKDIEALQDSAYSYIQSGEAEALEFETELIGVVPEGSEIEIDDKVYTFEDVTYINKSVDELISENLNEGDVIAILQANGDGYI